MVWHQGLPVWSGKQKLFNQWGTKWEQEQYCTFSHVPVMSLATKHFKTWRTKAVTCQWQFLTGHSYKNYMTVILSALKAFPIILLLLF